MNCLLGFAQVILPCASLVGVFLIMGGVQALLSDGGSGFRVVQPLADEGLARPVGCWIKGAGGNLEENATYQGKRMVPWLVGVVYPMFFMVLGGRGFVFVMSFWILGLMMIRGDVFHRMSEFLFLGKGLGDVSWLLHYPVSPG